VLRRSDIDAIRDLAEAYPLSVFPDAIGLPREGRENLLPYGNMAFNAFGPRNELFEESFANAQKVMGWIQGQCQRDALDPEGIGAQVYRAAGEEAVSEEEAGLLVRSLLTAGLDTTIFGLGAALYCFARFPDQWQALRADPQKARGAFEEVIRYISPVQTFFRTTTRAVDVSGVSIAPDQKVMLFLAAREPGPASVGGTEPFQHPPPDAGSRGLRLWDPCLRGPDGRSARSGNPALSARALGGIHRADRRSGLAAEQHAARTRPATGSAAGRLARRTSGGSGQAARCADDSFSSCRSQVIPGRR
jgi:hypothetical protein